LNLEQALQAQGQTLGVKFKPLVRGAMKNVPSVDVDEIIPEDEEGQLPGQPQIPGQLPAPQAQPEAVQIPGGFTQ
jgi:hypothetical protein